jgi:hypothetical protein
MRDSESVDGALKQSDLALEVVDPQLQVNRLVDRLAAPADEIHGQRQEQENPKSSHAPKLSR